MRTTWMAMLAASLLAVAAPLAAAPIEVVHRQGTTTLEVPPARTVVFDLAVLDHMDALGVDAVGVPDARFPAHLARYGGEAVAKVGTLFEPDLDAVRALAPDLIIVGGRSARQREALSAIAPTIDLGTDPAAFFDSVTGNLATLGRIHGREARAAELADRLRARREAIAHALDGQDGLVLFTVRGNAMAHAPGARFGIFHDLLGLAAVLPEEAGDTGPRPAAGTPEAAAAREAQARTLAAGLAADPDWLLVLDRGLATGDTPEPTDLAALPAIAASRAFGEGRVFHLDPAAWYITGGGYGVVMATFDAWDQRLGID
jgi:iron complex transport system substrate-binding protein